MYVLVMPRTGRPAKGGQAIYVRLPEDVVETLDERLEALRIEHPGMSGITRSDLVRDIVVKDVLAWRDSKTKKGGRRP